jgi:hypothetical protein
MEKFNNYRRISAKVEGNLKFKAEVESYVGTSHVRARLILSSLFYKNLVFLLKV